MRRQTQPRHDASLTSYWMLRRIGAAVTVRRLELALGRSDLAARVGVPTATVADIENGRYDPRMILAPHLETVLAMVPGTIDQSVRDDLQPSTGGQRTERPR